MVKWIDRPPLYFLIFSSVYNLSMGYLIISPICHQILTNLASLNVKWWILLSFTHIAQICRLQNLQITIQKRSQPVKVSFVPISHISYLENQSSYKIRSILIFCGKSHFYSVFHIIYSSKTKGNADFCQQL